MSRIEEALHVRAVPGLDPALDAVAASAPRAFLTCSWFAAAGGAAPRTLVAEAGGRVLLALPTVALKGPVRTVPGAYWPFRSFAIADDADPAALGAALSTPLALRTLGAAWRLGPLPADDPALAAVRASPRWTVLERRIATAFTLPIGAGRGDAWPRSSTLKKNRFHEKHLAAAGPLAWRFASGPDWTPALFDALAAIEAKSWHRTSADAKFLSARHRAFWEALAQDPAQAARMHAALLTVGGEGVAFAFDLDCGPVKYAIANSYDAALAKHSPGKCLSYRMLAEAAARGVRLVDWGAGDSGYKSTMGAEPGAEIVDCLILRGRAGRIAAPLLGRVWARSGQPPAPAPDPVTEA